MRKVNAATWKVSRLSPKSRYQITIQKSYLQSSLHFVLVWVCQQGPSILQISFRIPWYGTGIRGAHWLGRFIEMDSSSTPSLILQVAIYICWRNRLFHWFPIFVKPYPRSFRLRLVLQDITTNIVAQRYSKLRPPTCSEVSRNRTMFPTVARRRVMMKGSWAPEPKGNFQERFIIPKAGAVYDGKVPVLQMKLVG